MWSCIVNFFLSSCNLQNPPAYGKRGPAPEKMSQTLLTNKKQENTINYTPLTNYKPSQFCISRRKYVYFNGKWEEPLKN
jgi:hypothetical protein